MIDWAPVQRALTRAGFPCGAIDGDDGQKTYTAVFAFAANRQPDAVINALGKAGARWLKGDAITQTPQRFAEFTAQCGNETGGFTTFEEDLRYSAASMLRLWPTHFTADLAASCVGDPRKVACHAYGGRMGNAPWPSDDGWFYRGRGMLQLTGRDNYAAFEKLTGLPLLAHPELAADPADSLVIAREFWRRGKVNEAIDAGDFEKARRITNGGTIGLQQVAQRRARLLTVLA